MGYGIFIVAVLVVSLGSVYIVAPRIEDEDLLQCFGCLVITVANLILALGSVLSDGFSVFTAAHGVIMGIYGKKAWDHWRRRKKKRPSRIHALVKIIEGRLKVVPA
jgi:hypothetical protein